jgi:LAO/AO transport system kinase
VLLTVASEGAGVDAVADAVLGHRGFLEASGELNLRRRRRAAHDLAMAIRGNIDNSIDSDEPTADLLDTIVARRTDPWTAADRLLYSR